MLLVVVVAMVVWGHQRKIPNPKCRMVSGISTSPNLQNTAKPYINRDARGNSHPRTIATSPPQRVKQRTVPSPSRLPPLQRFDSSSVQRSHLNPHPSITTGGRQPNIAQKCRPDSPRNWNATSRSSSDPSYQNFTTRLQSSSHHHEVPKPHPN